MHNYSNCGTERRKAIPVDGGLFHSGPEHPPEGRQPSASFPQPMSTVLEKRMVRFGIRVGWWR
jgi:hypothetical protein